MSVILDPPQGVSVFDGGFETKFAEDVYLSKYAWRNDFDEPVEDWAATAHRVAWNNLKALGYKATDEEFTRIRELIVQRKFLPGGRYLASSGRPLHQINNCFMLRAEDSREGWAELWYKVGMIGMTGGGVGIDYSDIRPFGSIIKKTGGIATGPIALAKSVNDLGRAIVQGGTRRIALWAGLSWRHKDIFEFIKSKDNSPQMRALKEVEPDTPLPMDLTNISVMLDDDFFRAYDGQLEGEAPDGSLWVEWAHRVYALAVERMVRHGEPGFSIDVGPNAGETLRNPCCEIVSHDDSDVCNLGSINLSKIESPEELEEVVKYGILFLMAGTVYSDVPYDKVEQVRAKNRRLGLGLMGIHEWLASRGKPYGPDQELADWLKRYEKSGAWASYWARKHNLSVPIKTRAIAPNGTISILGETTSSIEPILCVAYKRYYYDGRSDDGRFLRNYQYVIDPTAQRLIANGANPDEIEDAYGLAHVYERRIAFQAWMQQFVDNAISSTINLPAPIEDQGEVEEFGRVLMRYLPQLRGITVYPNGARGGQPLQPVSYDEAMNSKNIIFAEEEERCSGGVCSI